MDRKALEDAVLSQVRVMADILMEEREVRRKAGKNNRKETLEGIVSDSAKRRHGGKPQRCVCMSSTRPEISAGRFIWSGLKTAGYGWKN